MCADVYRSLHKMADQLDVAIDSDAKAGIQFCKAVAHVCVRMIDDGATFSTGSLVFCVLICLLTFLPFDLRVLCVL